MAPPHGPRRRVPASRLPYATRRRGPPPTFGPVRPAACASLVRLCPSPVFTSPSLKVAPFISTMTVLQLHHRASTRNTARRLRQHRPTHPSASLRSSSASTLVIRVARCGLRLSPASASRPPPVSSPLKATPTACSARLPSPPSLLPAACCRPRRSRQRRSTRRRSPGRCSSSTTAPIHFEPARCWLGSSPPATSHRSCRPTRCARRRRCRSAFASPGAGFAVTGFRTTPCTCVRASACASVSVLGTTAFTTSRTHRHSIAVAAPRRRVLRRPFPFACAPGFFVPDRLRGLWFSHPTHRGACRALSAPGRATRAPRPPSHHGKGVCSL